MNTLGGVVSLVCNLRGCFLSTRCELAKRGRLIEYSTLVWGRRDTRETLSTNPRGPVLEVNLTCIIACVLVLPELQSARTFI